MHSVDDYTYLAYSDSEMLPDEKGTTVAAFVGRALNLGSTDIAGIKYN